MGVMTHPYFHNEKVGTHQLYKHLGINQIGLKKTKQKLLMPNTPGSHFEHQGVNLQIKKKNMP
jgi:hypothetical protein